MIENYADHSANERTFLAWVRTAMAIVGFGLAAARLSGEKAAMWSEVLMLAAGGVVILLAYLRMRYVTARIRAAEISEDFALVPDTFLVLLIVALFGLLGTFAIHVGTP
ncbi:MAG: DUF202 domain-containing protein [Pseudodonghicola sp.]|nr:DUF202 domain-containing protein [Pseudodonghicola sp.]